MRRPFKLDADRLNLLLQVMGMLDVTPIHEQREVVVLSIKCCKLSDPPATESRIGVTQFSSLTELSAQRRCHMAGF